MNNERYYELLGESVMNTYRDLGAILAEAMGLDIQEGIKSDARRLARIRRNQSGNTVPEGGTDRVTQYGYESEPHRFRPETREKLKHQDAATLAAMSKRADRRAARIAAAGETPQGIKRIEAGLARGNKGAKQHGRLGAKHNLFQTSPVVKTHSDLASDAADASRRLQQAAGNARFSARKERLDNLEAKQKNLEGQNDPKSASKASHIGTIVSRFRRKDPRLEK